VVAERRNKNVKNRLFCQANEAASQEKKYDSICLTSEEKAGAAFSAAAFTVSRRAQLDLGANRAHFRLQFSL
jgi:hypothetical protein